MIWTIVAVLAVLATKFVTALRLKDLKAKLEAINPHINELRGQLHEVEDEHENLKLKEDATTTRLTHLKGVVSHLESTVKAPANASAGPDERQQMLEAAEERG